MHDLPHLPCKNLAPMAFMLECVNVCSWHQNKKTQDKLESDMWKSNKQTSMWNRSSKPWIYEKGSKIEALHVKIETKLEKLGLGLLGRIMRMHEQACMCIIKLVHVAKIMRMWVLAQKS